MTDFEDTLQEHLHAYARACIESNDWDRIAPVGMTKKQQAKEQRLHNAVERTYTKLLDHIRSAPMGLPGQFTGLVDINDTPIHVGDEIAFDEREWGHPHSFIVGYEDGELRVSGSIFDLSQWCTVMRKWNEDPVVEPEPEEPK